MMAISLENIREIRKLHVEAFRDYAKTVIIYLNQRKMLATARGKNINVYEEKINEAMNCYHKGATKIKKNLEMLETQLNSNEVFIKLALYNLKKHRDAILKLQSDTTKLQNKMSNNYIATRRSRVESTPIDAKANIWNESLNETDRLEQHSSLVSDYCNSRIKRISHLKMNTARRLACEFVYATESNCLNLKKTEFKICKYILAEI